MRGIQAKQTGIALIVSLIILLLLTIIMVSALRVTTLEEKMSGNSQDQNIAFQAAETALREAEAYINSGATPFNPLKLSAAPFRDPKLPYIRDEDLIYCVSGLCSDSKDLQSDIFPNVDGEKITATTGIPGIVREPEYIIELIRTDPGPDASRKYATFRVTTQAWGEKANTVVRLQSTYRLHALSFDY